MSFVENIVAQLAKSGFESITKPQEYDTSDTTFAKLLEKQMSAQEADASDNLLGEMGMPAGLTIEPYDPNNTTISTDNAKSFVMPDISDVEIKDFSIDSFFPDFLHNSSKQDSPLMNMAFKYATDMYNSHGRNFVEDIVDLADGLTGRL